MICRMCGTTLSKKNICSDGMYECPHCGKLYSPEEARHPQKHKMTQKARARHRRAIRRRIVTCLAVAAVLITAVALAIFFNGGNRDAASPVEVTDALDDTDADPEGAQSAAPLETPEPTLEPTPELTTEPTSEPTPEANTASVHFRAVGDIMSHKDQLNLARQKDGSYNYDSQFICVKDALSKADYTIANLELTISVNDSYTGYPGFRIPESILTTLKDCGIDMFTMANNHMLDGKFEGLVHTVDKVEEYGFAHVGAYRTAEEAGQPVVADINGIRFGFLAYTDHVNENERHLTSEQAGFCVKLLSRADFRSDVQALRDLGAEVVICMPHWGNEGRRAVPAANREYARAMVEAGVDIILGSHPHMVQPIDMAEMEVNGVNKDILIAWSLGNFISNQTYRYEDSGIILDFTVTREEDGGIRIHDVGYVPVFVCNTPKIIRVVCSGDFYNDQPEDMPASSYYRMRQSVNELVELLGEDGLTVLQN